MLRTMNTVVARTTVACEAECFVRRALGAADDATTHFQVVVGFVTSPRTRPQPTLHHEFRAGVRLVALASEGSTEAKTGAVLRARNGIVGERPCQWYTA